MNSIPKQNNKLKNYKRVLIGSPINQNPMILKEFLFSLENLTKEEIQVDYFFIDDNASEASSQLLNQFSQNFKNVTLQKSNCLENYERNQITHFWTESLIWKVAKFKNLVIEKAIQENYDHLFLIDSDLILNPHTLEHLIKVDKDIISEIYWTQWQPNTPILPQVWLSDQYTLFYRERGETIPQEEASKRQNQFLKQLEEPGVYKVGGLGACTLISKRALLAGVNFKEIKNLSFWGEDRHFCVRAVALGFSLFVDTHFPGYHIYRESDLKGVEDFKKKNGLTSQVFLTDEKLDMVQKPVLSLCMIVKNERQNLPRCLASVQPYVNEIVVVDTGSEDETPEIAREFGARLEFFEWCNDFAAARNYALSKVTGDWILVLDADEELIVTSEDFLIQLTSSPEILAYSLSLTDVDSQEGMTPLQTLRLFRNKEEFRYVSGYHEQLTYQGRAISHNLIGQLDGVQILHYGYGTSQLYQKNINRNIPILESIRQKEGLSLMLLYCLAGMYNDTQQTEEAQECYTEAFDKLLPDLIDGNAPKESGFVPSLMFVLGTQFLQQEDYETVRLLCQRGLEWFPTHPPLNYLTGSALKVLGFPLGASVYFKTCLELNRDNSYYKGEPFEQSYMTTYPAYELGRIYIELEQPLEALAAFEQVLSFGANFMDAQQKVDMIKQYLATQA